MANEMPMLRRSSGASETSASRRFQTMLSMQRSVVWRRDEHDDELITNRGVHQERLSIKLFVLHHSEIPRAFF